MSETASGEAGTNEAGRVVRSRRTKWISAVVGVILVAVVAAVILNGGARGANGAEDAGEETEESAPIPVEVATVIRDAVSAYVTATANLVAEYDVTVLGESEGRVTSMIVDEGDVVRRGQMLARLDPSDEAIALKKAQLRHANAELVFERGRDLFERELISREENDRLTVDYQIAQQELAESQWALAQTVIEAPFAGRVTARHIQLGQHVRLGDPLFQITDFDPLIARIYLSERDVVGLTQGPRRPSGSMPTRGPSFAAASARSARSSTPRRVPSRSRWKRCEPSPGRQTGQLRFHPRGARGASGRSRRAARGDPA